MTRASADREARLRHSVKRMGYELVDGERRGTFYIRRAGSKIDEAADLFGLDLAGVEQWIRQSAKGLK